MDWQTVVLIAIGAIVGLNVLVLIVWAIFAHKITKDF